MFRGPLSDGATHSSADSSLLIYAEHIPRQNWEPGTSAHCVAASKYGSDTPTLQALTTAWPFSVTTSSRHVCSEGTAAVSDQLGRRRMAIAAQTRATPHLRPPSGSSRLLSRNRSNTIPKSKEPSFYVPVNLTKSAGSPCIAVNVRPDNNIDDHYQKVFSTTQQSANLAAVAVAVIESGPSPAPSSSTCTGSTTTSIHEAVKKTE